MIFRILQIAIPFVWFGLVIGISFIEAPLKFTAPNITLALGLGIGYVVFHALNTVEIALCVATAASWFLAKPKGKSALILFGSIALILILQTFWLFPLLDERTMQVINGTAEPYSRLHVFYIVFDSVKVLLLLTLGVVLLRQNLVKE